VNKAGKFCKEVGKPLLPGTFENYIGSGWASRGLEFLNVAYYIGKEKWLFST
jgi:hypothetical protein